MSEYFASRDVFHSDRPNIINGHLNTTAGALLSRDELLRELRAREAERVPERVARVEQEVQSAARRAQRAEDATITQRCQAELARQGQITKRSEVGC